MPPLRVVLANVSGLRTSTDPACRHAPHATLAIEWSHVEIVTVEMKGTDAFYDFPAEHWKHIRTTNPIESTFATMRLRTTKTKGCLSRMTALAMVFKLCQSASKKWRRLDGSHQIAGIIQGVKFKDGEKLTERAA